MTPSAVILIIKWRRILRINWRSRELARDGSLVRSLVAGARWASVFPSGNHGVRLFVGDEGFRTYWWMAAHRSFAGQALFGNLEHRMALILAIETTDAVDVPLTFAPSVVQLTT